MRNIVTAKFKTVKCESPRAAAIAYAKANGATRIIGSGMFAQVYGSASGNKVYKVCRTDDNAGAYLPYIRKVAKLKKKNPHAPVVYEIIDFMSRPNSYDEYGNYTVVVLEKLKRADGQTAGIAEDLYHLLEYKIGLSSKMKLFNISKDFLQIVKIVRSVVMEHKCHLDMHSGNFMFRVEGKNKSVVFTDPVC